MTYVELQNQVLKLNNQIKEWVSFVEELKDENTELKSKLQELQNTKSAETKKLYLVIDRNWDEVLEKYSCPVILEEENGDDGVYTVIKDERDGKYLDYIRGNVCQYVVKCVEYEAKVR